MSWEALKTGDVVDVVAPSYGLTEDELKSIGEYLESLGLKSNIPSNLTGPDLFCSNSAEYRLLHLKQALENDESKAVWCARGGYGAAQLLPMMETIEKPKKEKIFIGFSDATAIHIFLNQFWGWPSIHASMLRQIADKEVDEASINKLQRLLFGQDKEVTLESLTPLNEAAKEKGDIETTVTGGNVSIIQTSLATDWELDPSGKILLLEDTDEKSYVYSRMLLHLKQAGILERASAVLLGDFEHHPDEDERITEMFRLLAAEVKVPVFHTAEVGHRSANFPVPLGTKATLTINDTATLTVACR